MDSRIKMIRTAFFVHYNFFSLQNPPLLVLLGPDQARDNLLTTHFQRRLAFAL